MTSFGVRRWVDAVAELPDSVTDIYLLGCPTFFVDQLNMVVNFGGAMRVLTVVAPYACAACGAEAGRLIDVLADRALLARGEAPAQTCARCRGKLVLDENA